MCPVGHRDEEEKNLCWFFFSTLWKKVIILCCFLLFLLYSGNYMVKLWFGCHFFLGAKLSALLCWCQIVLVPNCPVPNCPFLLCWCQIVLVPNCPVPNCPGAKLSWCQIVRCQIVRCQIVLPPAQVHNVQLHNLLKDKTAIEKLWLTIKCIPLFSITAFFRVGSAVPKVDTVFTFKCPFLHLGHGAFLGLNHPHLVRPFLLHSLSLVNLFLSSLNML